MLYYAIDKMNAEVVQQQEEAKKDGKTIQEINQIYSQSHQQLFEISKSADEATNRLEMQ